MKKHESDHLRNCKILSKSHNKDNCIWIPDSHHTLNLAISESSIEKEARHVCHEHAECTVNHKTSPNMLEPVLKDKGNEGDTECLHHKIRGKLAYKDNRRWSRQRSESFGSPNTSENYRKESRSSFDNNYRKGVEIHKKLELKNKFKGNRITYIQERNFVFRSDKSQESNTYPKKHFTVSNEALPVSNSKIVHFQETLSNANFLSVKLSLDIFQKVKVTVAIKPYHYWVQLVDLEEKLIDIMLNLNNGPDSLALQQVERGTICRALYDDLWYRCLVTSVKPELKVLYIDFGNEEPGNLNQLQDISEALKEIPPMAFKVKLADGTSKKYESLTEEQVLSVKCVAIHGDLYIVQVEGEIYDKCIRPDSCSDEVSKKTTDRHTMKPDSCSSNQVIKEASDSLILKPDSYSSDQGSKKKSDSHTLRPDSCSSNQVIKEASDSLILKPDSYSSGQGSKKTSDSHTLRPDSCSDQGSKKASDSHAWRPESHASEQGSEKTSDSHVLRPNSRSYNQGSKNTSDGHALRPNYRFYNKGSMNTYAWRPNFQYYNQGSKKTYAWRPNFQYYNRGSNMTYAWRPNFQYYNQESKKTYAWRPKFQYYNQGSRKTYAWRPNFQYYNQRRKNTSDSHAMGPNSRSDQLTKKTSDSHILRPVSHTSDQLIKTTSDSHLLRLDSHSSDEGSKKTSDRHAWRPESHASEQGSDKTSDSHVLRPNSRSYNQGSRNTSDGHALRPDSHSSGQGNKKTADSHALRPDSHSSDQGSKKTSDSHVLRPNSRCSDQLSKKTSDSHLLRPDSHSSDEGSKKTSDSHAWRPESHASEQGNEKTSDSHVLRPNSRSYNQGSKNTSDGHELRPDSHSSDQENEKIADSHALRPDSHSSDQGNEKIADSHAFRPDSYSSDQGNEKIADSHALRPDSYSSDQGNEKIADSHALRPDSCSCDQESKKTFDSHALPLLKDKFFLESAVMRLKVGMKGHCKFQQKLCGGDFLVSVMYPEIWGKYEELCELSLNDPIGSCYEANIGDFVTVKCTGVHVTWKRARVLAVTDYFYEVILCDFGLLTRVEKVHTLPERSMSIPEFGAKCSIIKKSEFIAQNCLKQIYKFKVIRADKIHGTPICALYNEEGIEGEYLCEVVLKQLVTMSYV